MKQGKCKRAGLLATQGIRGGANREVLKRIKETGDIFFAESDRDWVLDGANVHVSMVGFDDGAEDVTRRLNGKTVATDQRQPHGDARRNDSAASWQANQDISFHGDHEGRGLSTSPRTRRSELLTAPNPHGKPNSDVFARG